MPFIDTPQLILCNFLGLKDPLDLTLEMVEDLVLGKKEYGEDSKFATLKWINENFTEFKAASILFGVNHPRYQSSWKKYENFRELFYERYMKMLIKEMYNQYNNKNDEEYEFCEICGISIGQFNFSENIVSIKSDIYNEYNLNLKTKDKYALIGRDVFPLVGSMGSESQIMGNMTKSFVICPRCLFMVNYLLFSAQIIDGKWALFNIGNIDHLYKLIRSLMKEIIKRIKIRQPNSPIENLGVDKKNKLMRLFDTIFQYFDEYSLDFSDPTNFLEATKIKNEFISMWKFSNAGQGAELEIQDLPNRFIRFLWLAYVLDLQDGIKKILIQEAKIKIHPSKRLYLAITDGRWYFFDKIHKIKGFKVDPFIPLLFGNVVLNIKLDYLKKILKIVSYLKEKIKKEDHKEILNDRKYFKLQILIQGTIEDMLHQEELTSIDLENIFGYIPNSNQFLDSASLINFLIQLEIDLDTYKDYSKKIKEILPDKWLDFIDNSVDNNIIKNSVIQQEFLRIYLYIGRLIKNKYKEENKKDKFFNRQLSRLPLSWLTKNFSNLGLKHKNFDWNTYQNLFFLGSKITDYQGNYIPKKINVWYPLRKLFGYYMRSWFIEDLDFDKAIDNLSNELPILIHKFSNQNMEEFQNLLEIFVKDRFLKRGKKNSIRYFTQVMNGQISEGYFIDQMSSYLKDITKLEHSEHVIGKTTLGDFKNKIEKLEDLWENCYLNIIDNTEGKQNSIFLKLTLPNIIRSTITSYDKNGSRKEKESLLPSLEKNNDFS